MENTTQNHAEMPEDNNAQTSAEPKNQDGEATDVPTAGQDSEVSKLRDELAESRDKYIRLSADFENFRRRTAKERIELIQTATSQLLKDLLPVIDDFERVEKAMGDKSGQQSEGFMLSLNKFRRMLEMQGLKAMDAAGNDFDPDMHEAITQVPNPEKVGKVLDVVEKGYLLHDKVIRYAKVVVGS